MLLPILLAVASVAPSATCRCSDCRTVQAEPGGRVVAKTTLFTKSETDQFVVWSYDSSWPAADVSKLAEERRSCIARHWRGKRAEKNWQPKCQIVLHVSRQSYLAAVGRGGERTFGSSLLDIRGGVCRARRIDLLAEPNNQLSALSHELTHVILADMIPERRLPRWLDEGIALLADSHDKQLRHSHDLRQAQALGTALPLPELIRLEDYPAAAQIPAFYGGSASITAFLARHGKPAQLLDFATQSLDHGYDQALREVYQIDGVAELDRMWRNSDEEVVYSVTGVLGKKG